MFVYEFLAPLNARGSLSARSRTHSFVYSPSCVDKWAPLTGTQRRVGAMLIVNAESTICINVCTYG